MAIGKKSSRGEFKGSRSIKSMGCKYCGEKVQNVDEKVDAVTCYKCVMKLCAGVQLKIKQQ
jgi:hypothetical protein